MLQRLAFDQVGMAVLAESTDLAPPSGVDAWEAAWFPWD
jgi:hypothetical protein